MEGSPHPGHRRRRVRIPVSPGNKSPGPEALFLSPTHTHAHFVQEQRSGKSQSAPIRSRWQSSAPTRFPGFALRVTSSVWFQLPFDSRDLCPSLTQYRQPEECCGLRPGPGLGEQCELFLTERQRVPLFAFQGISQGLISQSPRPSWGGKVSVIIIPGSQLRNQRADGSAKEFLYGRTSRASVWSEADGTVPRSILCKAKATPTCQPLGTVPWHHHRPH